MGALFVWLWIVGGFPAAVLGEVVQAESPRIARAGRIAFALLLAVDLLLAALVFLVGTAAPTAHMTRSLWWFTIIVAGVPLALVSGLAVRRGYTGHRVALVTACSVDTAEALRRARQAINEITITVAADATAVEPELAVA